MKHTALHSLHLELGARMVPFSGYEMPVQYQQGIKHEHAHTRSKAGLFDISHMGQLKIFGEEAPSLLETLVPGDITGLLPGQQRYTVLTNNKGGIIDDLMVARMEDHLFLVVNAACKEKDISYLRESLAPACTIEVLDQQALLALQGPEAATVLSEYIRGLDDLDFMRARNAEIGGIPCMINRCGYTGEDGFEISVAAGSARELANLLLSHHAVEPVGLGARDTLRLEAGLCLYGHDIDEETTVVEAGLAWVVAKKYREAKAEPKFPGAEKILVQLAQSPEIIRTGFRPEGKIPVREGTQLLTADGEDVGRITSGGYGQTAGGPIAMGYVGTKFSEPGTALLVNIRGREHTIRTATLPFVEHRYYKK